MQSIKLESIALNLSYIAVNSTEAEREFRRS